jgi:predicted nucleic acid-binding protein
VRSLVLDTSVAIAWYLPETFRAGARAWQSRLLDGRVRLVVPGLHYWEFGNVLRTYVMRSELESDLAEQIWSLHLDAPLEVAEPERAEVLATALEYGATVYDAVYIALSRSLDLPLLTAERTTTPWVVKLGRAVETVRER